MEHVIYGTWGVAEEFLQKGCLPESVMCLEGLLEKVSELRTKYPILSAKTRLRLATILIKYTSNLSQAQMHLEKALLSTQHNDDEISLRLRIMKELASVYTAQSQYPLTKNMLTQGIQNAESHHKQRWIDYFRIQLIHTHLYDDNTTNSLELISQGLKSLKEIDNNCNDSSSNLYQRFIRLIYLLIRSQIYLRHFDHQNALMSLEKTYTTLKTFNKMNGTEHSINSNNSNNSNNNNNNNTAQQQQKKMSSINSLDSTENSIDIIDDYTFHKLEIHYLILKIMFCLRTETLNECEELLQQLQQTLILLKESKNTRSKNSLQYDWVSEAAVFVLSNLLSVVVYRSMGSLTKAEEFVHRGSAIIERRLHPLQSMAQSNPEIKFDRGTNDDILLLISLKFFFVSNQVLVHLSRSDFLNAAKDIIIARQFMLTYPHLFEEFRMDIHLMIALYCLSLRLFNGAQQHLDVILSDSSSTSPLIQTWATVFSITIDVAHLPEENYREKAISKIRKLDNTHDIASVTGIKAIVDFYKGILSSNSSKSLKYLQRSLVKSDSVLKNSQMLSQVLQSLGAVYTRRADLSLSLRCLSNAVIWGNRIGDLLSQIHAMTLLAKSYDQTVDTTPEDEEKMESNQKYLQQKQEEYEKRYWMAVNSDEHWIVNWLPSQDSLYQQLLDQSQEQ